MKRIIAFLILGALQLAAQDTQSCPMHKEHIKEASQHQADVEKHGDEAMGFPHGPNLALTNVRVLSYS